MSKNKILLLAVLFAAGILALFLLKREPVARDLPDSLSTRTNDARSQPVRSISEEGKGSESVLSDLAKNSNALPMSAQELDEAERRLIEIFLGGHASIVRSRKEIENLLVSLENHYGTDNTAKFLIESLGSGNALPKALKALFKASKASAEQLISCYTSLEIGDGDRSGAFEMLTTRVLNAPLEEFPSLWQKLLASPLPPDSGQQMMESSKINIIDLSEKYLSNDFSDEAMSAAKNAAFRELWSKSDLMSPELRSRYVDSLLSGYATLDPNAAFKSLIEYDVNGDFSATRDRLVAMVMRENKVKGSLEILKAGGTSNDLKIVGGYWAEASSQQFTEFFEASSEKLDIEQKLALTRGFAETQISRGMFAEANNWVDWIEENGGEGSEASASLELKKDEYVSMQMASKPKKTLERIVAGELGSVATLEVAFEKWLSSSRPEEAASWLAENSKNLTQEMHDSTSMAYVKYASNLGDFGVADSWIENINDPVMKERAQEILVERQKK